MAGPCTSGFWTCVVLVLMATTATVTGQGTGGFIVRAVSTGKEDPGAGDGGYRNKSYIVSNGQEIRIHRNALPHERGHQAFILNEWTGEVIDKDVFDTHWGGTQAAGQLTTFLEGAAAGRILAIVVHDSGDGVRVNLAPYGSTITTALGFRESYAMITQKGPKPSWFVERKSAIRSGPTIVEAYIPGCPHGYRAYMDGCFRFWGGRNGKSYSGARQVCQQDGGDIYMWRDADAVARLKIKLISDNSPSLWIGLSDEDVEGTWVWADGMVLDGNDFTDWFPDPPVNTPGKDCAVARKSTQYRWRAARCSKRRAFICHTQP